jgi:alpha-L-fucosidase
MIWFDTPGGMTRDETRDFVRQLRQLQPDCLFSSRVGQGMGDYKDYGDSEVPPGPMKGPWESIYTHNDTWGYISHDFNFKSPTEIIQLLATVASRGGNLMLNISPDGQGRIAAYTTKFLKAVGGWLNTNGESIYGTTAGFVPDQPWGVTTAKPGRLYLQLFNRPENDQVLVPGCDVQVTRVYALEDHKPLPYARHGKDLLIDLSTLRKESGDPYSSGTGSKVNSCPSRVIVVAYQGREPAYASNAPSVISGGYGEIRIPVSRAALKGQALAETLTYSHYFGDWKHTLCITGLKDTSDQIIFNVRFTDPGDYRLVLEYSCGSASEGQEGNLEIGGRLYWFRTLLTGEFNKKKPLMFIRHPVAIYSIRHPGTYQIKIQPVKSGRELFKLKSLIAIPIR